MRIEVADKSTGSLRSLLQGERKDSDAEVTAAAIELAEQDGDREARERIICAYWERQGSAALEDARIDPRDLAAVVARIPLVERIGSR